MTTKEKYMEALANANETPDWIEWHMKRCAEVVELPGVGLLPIEKQGIEKDFCFGYSDSRYDTEDYDRANDMAYHARTSEEYFISENMKSYKNTLDNLRPAADWNRDYMLVLRGSGEVKSLGFVRPCDVLEALGGSGNLDEMPGKTLCVRFADSYILKDEEIAAIRAGYEKAMKSHEKKVKAYLKRYGLSKVNSWSYWRDE